MSKKADKKTVFLLEKKQIKHYETKNPTKFIIELILFWHINTMISKKILL